MDAVIGLRIRTMREKAGLSQAKLGDALGISFQQIQKYETGRNRVSASRIAELSKVLQVPSTYFFIGTESAADDDLVALVRDNDRYLRRLVSSFNRVKDRTKRRKIVEILEAVIEALDADPG